MNVFLLNAFMLCVGFTPVYHPEDYHYYNESMQSRGLERVDKIYVNLSLKDDKQKFLDFADNIKTLERFKNVKTTELDGIILYFRNKKDTLDALNKCLEEKYPVAPIVIFEGVECTHADEILVTVQPSVNQDDFLKRLHTIAKADFSVAKVAPQTYLVKVTKLKNPSNVLILANLIAKDNVWVRQAGIAWRPVDGYVRAIASVETPSVSHLGELRNLKVVLSVFDPNIIIRTDLLPQMGQGLAPFPFAGDVWFDPSPPEIKEIKAGKTKIVEITYPFRNLQYGNYVFQPLVISYEKSGQLKTVKTNVCQYSTRSVTASTEIDDIQPRNNDGLDLVILQPVGLPRKDDPMKSVYQEIKIAVSSMFFVFGGLLLLSAALELRQKLALWFKPNEHKQLWNDLLYCEADSSKAYYVAVSRHVNKILNELFGTSLYAVKREECTETFQYLVAELDKVFQAKPFYNSESLKDFVKRFCRERRYK